MKVVSSIGKSLNIINRNNCVVSWCEKIVTGGRAGWGGAGAV